MLVPLSATESGLESELLTMSKLPLKVPASWESNVISMVQLAPGASIEGTGMQLPPVNENGLSGPLI